MDIMTLATRLLAAAASLTLASVAVAQAPPAKENGPIVVIGEKPPRVDKIQCKTLSTGTLFPKRVCLPQSEWANAEQQSRDALRGMREWQRMRCRNALTC